MDDKLIVSNRSALTAKYGTAGFAKIKAAVATLISADARRGIKSRIVYLDDAAAMKRFGGRAVTDASSERQNKEAIDAVFKATVPEYLLILGAIDVVPHQDLANPMFDPPDDDDKYAFGDLPYACDAPYARDIAKFKGPTRVVGRLPDLTGAREPSYLLDVLRVAAKYETREVVEYNSYFGLSTQSWRKSTALSLFNVFGSSDALTLSPPNGPKHPAARLSPLVHFINCHGGESDPTFYGEEGSEQPPSLSSNAIEGKIKVGTIAAVECCYGAELYDSVTLALPLPICQKYLKQGAYGYFGSSTIAYGPSSGNGTADLITQYFLLAILDGASLGRAALLARQRFIQQTSELDPADLKTLAQFSLLGDPSIHPVKISSATALPPGIDKADAHRHERRERRAKLRATGEFLRDTKPTASRRSRSARTSPTVAKALANIARQAGIGTKKAFTAYDVKTPPATRASRVKGRATTSRYHVAVYRSPVDGAPGRSVVAVAKESGGRIVSYRIYEAK
jgi:hypothetical protein